MTEYDNNPDCSEITDDILLSYAEGRLEEELGNRVKAHLDGCEQCRIRAREVGLIGGALAADGGRDIVVQRPTPGCGSDHWRADQS